MVLIHLHLNYLNNLSSTTNSSSIFDEPTTPSKRFVVQDDDFFTIPEITTTRKRSYSNYSNSSNEDGLKPSQIIEFQRLSQPRLPQNIHFNTPIKEYENDEEENEDENEGKEDKNENEEESDGDEENEVKNENEEESEEEKELVKVIAKRMKVLDESLHVRNYYRRCSGSKETKSLTNKDTIIFLTMSSERPKKLDKRILICDFVENAHQFDITTEFLINAQEDEKNKEKLILEQPLKKVKKE